MNKKEIQRKRTMIYFIEAADEILRKEGIKGITIRKVAKIAGYNSATIYNYFENLDHLILFTSMKYVKPYALALPEYIKDTTDPVEKFRAIWECFCYYSFKDPEIYYSIFFANLNKNLDSYVRDYYKLFPEELGEDSHGLNTMLLKSDIYERGMSSLDDSIEEGLLPIEDAEDLNNICTIIYKGILLDRMHGKYDYEEAFDRAMRYINITIGAFFEE